MLLAALAHHLPNATPDDLFAVQGEMIHADGGHRQNGCAQRALQHAASPARLSAAQRDAPLPTAGQPCPSSHPVQSANLGDRLRKCLGDASVVQAAQRTTLARKALKVVRRETKFAALIPAALNRRAIRGNNR